MWQYHSLLLLLLPFTCLLMSILGAAANCPAGWAKFDGNQQCYKVFIPPNARQLNMVGARLVCQEAGAEMASVHGEPENEFIKGLVFLAVANGGPQYRSGPRYHIWLGLQLERNAQNKIVGAQWTDGSAVDWANPLDWAKGHRPWAPGEPNDSKLAKGGHENCVQMYGQGRQAGLWNDISCVQTTIGVFGGCATSDGSGVVCKKAAQTETTTTTTSTTPSTTTTKPTPAEKCPTGWAHFDGNCYQANAGGPNGKTFAQSEQECVRKGAHLASIHGRQENDFVRDQINGIVSNGTGGGKSYFWIGLRIERDNPADQTFVARWTDGSDVTYGNPIGRPIQGKAPWAPGEPNNMNDAAGWGEECTMVYGFKNGGAQVGQWNDMACDRAKADYWEGATAGYVCKKKANSGGGTGGK